MGKILLIESDQGLASLISISLENFGHQVACIFGTHQYNFADHYDLLIIDYNLGDSNSSSGIEFYRKIKESALNLSAILIANLAEEAVLVEALRAGVRDFLPKDHNFIEALPLIVERVMKDLQDEKELQASKLMRLHTMETHHRVKNSFQVVHSLLNMELRKHRVLDKGAVAKVASHLQSLSLIHDLLIENIASREVRDVICVGDLIPRLIAALYLPNLSRQIEVDVDFLLVDPRVASSLAVIVTELLVNALKYGQGITRLFIKAEQQSWAFLSVSNQVSVEQREKVLNQESGSKLIEFLARSDFKSEIKSGIDNSGEYHCQMTFPVLVPESNDRSRYI